MSWQSAPDFSRGLLAGYGFVDTLFQRRRQIDLQEREMSRIGRIDAENNRRYEIDQARQREIDAQNKELFNRQTADWQVATANRLRGEHAFGIAGNSQFDFDKLQGREREFVFEQMNNNPTLANIYGNWQNNEWREDQFDREQAARARERAAAEQAMRDLLMPSVPQEPPAPSAAAGAPPPMLDRNTAPFVPGDGRAYDFMPPADPTLRSPELPPARGRTDISFGMGWGEQAPIGAPIGEIEEKPGAPKAPSKGMTQDRFWTSFVHNDSPWGRKYREEAEADPYKAVNRYWGVANSLDEHTRTITAPRIAVYARRSAEQAAATMRALPESVGVNSPEYKAAKRQLDRSLAVLSNTSNIRPAEQAELRALALPNGRFKAGDPALVQGVMQAGGGPDSPIPYAPPMAARGAITAMARGGAGQTRTAAQVNAAARAFGAGVPQAIIAKFLGGGDVRNEIKVVDGVYMSIDPETGFSTPIVNAMTNAPLIDAEEARKASEKWPTDRIEAIRGVAAANPITGDVDTDIAMIMAGIQNDAGRIRETWGVDASNIRAIAAPDLYTLATNVARYQREAREQNARWFRFTPYGSKPNENLAQFGKTLDSDSGNRPIPMPRTRMTPEQFDRARNQVISTPNLDPRLYMLAMMGDDALADELERQNSDIVSAPGIRPFGTE